MGYHQPRLRGNGARCYTLVTRADVDAGRGVDAISHSGATAVGGRAIGVLGTGIDVCYPKENKRLFEKMLEKEAIISELPTGSHPAPEDFPVRNRIIAGMPLGVVIVEGKQCSGSRHGWRWSLDAKFLACREM
jgi:DNA processing protein